MTRRPLTTTPNDDRSTLAHDVEFLRFLSERLADSQREADRCQHDIDTLMAQVDSKRREQAEHLNIVDACTAGLKIADRSTRPAPVLAPHVEDEPVTGGQVQQ
jgi:hypothetical protein